MHPGAPPYKVPQRSLPPDQTRTQIIARRFASEATRNPGSAGRGKFQHSRLPEREPSCAVALHYRYDNEAEERPRCKKHRRNKSTVSVA